MKKVVTALCAVTLLSGCASILSDSKYPVSIQGKEGSMVKVKDENGKLVHSAAMPTTVTLNASDEFFSKAHYTMEADGVSKEIAPKIDPWYWGNIVFGGVIGWFIVDPITGAMFKLPETVDMTEASN